MAATPIVPRFSPPGMLTDFTESQKNDWHKFISEVFDNTARGYSRYPEIGPIKYKIENNAPRPQFFNPAKVARAADFQEKIISWTGFPKQVSIDYASNVARWKAADQKRLVQDEYCEWSIKRNAHEKITSVTFTCEGPEYWEFLGATNPDKVVELYNKYNPGQNIKENDLFDGRKNYIHENKWNRDTQNGAMHLIQPNNSLIAEIELAGGSSIVRQIDGRILDEQQELIECGKYGEPNRNSDPLIGAEVNSLARVGAMVSLRDPVGLYFDKFEPTGWTVPDGSDPKSFWKVERGAADTPVRAVYEVPKEKGFTVSDIKINGTPIDYGAQIANFVRIKLVGIAQNINEKNIKPFGCVEYVKPSHNINEFTYSMFISTHSKPSWRYFPK